MKICGRDLAGKPSKKGGTQPEAESSPRRSRGAMRLFSSGSALCAAPQPDQASLPLAARVPGPCVTSSCLACPRSTPVLTLCSPPLAACRTPLDSSSTMAARPTATVWSTDGDSPSAASSVALPAVFTAPIRPDVVHQVHSAVSMNKRQPGTSICPARYNRAPLRRGRRIPTYPEPGPCCGPKTIHAYPEPDV